MKRVGGKLCNANELGVVCCTCKVWHERYGRVALLTRFRVRGKIAFLNLVLT